MTGPTQAGADASQLFRSTYQHEPDGVFSAPGRVNLIGEHTDYNSGLVLPFAIDARAEIAASPNPAGRIRLVSGQRPDETVDVSATDLAPGSIEGWAAYVVGAIWSLRQRGYEIGGFDLALQSAVPVGAGLSSSAAVECATVLAVSWLSGLRLPPEEIARIAQQDENDFVGIPCGLMDQMASSACRKDHVLYFDVQSETIEHIPFDPAAAGLSAMVVDTRAHHSLADGEYGRRRRSCEQAVAELGLRSLREVDDLDAALARLSSDVLRRRVRHVVTENERVRRVVAALRAGRIAHIGEDMNASHRSLRDDYEVSCDELDVTVDAALAAGAIGARMTGGGFGGSVITLVATENVPAVSEAVTTAFASHHFKAPELLLVQPTQGIRIESVQPDR